MQVIQDNSVLITLIFSGVVTISTLVYAVLTAQLVAETRRMRRAQTEPRIEVSIKPRDEYIKIVFLRVRNIGLGGAYNLRFALSGSGNEQGSKALIADFGTSNFFTSGLQYLGPGHEVLSGYTHMDEDYKSKVQAVIHCRVSYQDAAGAGYEHTYTIAFSELEGISQGKIDYMYEISRHLEQIGRDLRAIANRSTRVQVDTFDRDDRAEERRRLEEVRRQRAERRGNS